MSEGQVQVVVRTKTVPPSNPKATPKLSDGYELEAMYAQNRADDLARLILPPPVAPSDVDTKFRSQQSSELQGLTTLEEINAMTKRARKNAAKRRTFHSSHKRESGEKGVSSNGGSGDAKPKKAPTFKTNQRPVAIHSDRDKAKTGKRSAIAAKRETKRSLTLAEIEAAYEPIATSAIERFKASRVANLTRVLIALRDLVSPFDGHGMPGLVAYTVRVTRDAVGSGPSEDRVIDKRFLHSASTKALGELIKCAWHMMGPGESEDVTDDPEVRRRVGAARRRSVSTTGEFKIRLHETEDGREVFFILTVERSGRLTLHGIMTSRR